ncbi:alpha-L-rhamnosidase [Microbacterium gilvum]|uniref:alpha-L-rhamnosidase n=1 Tax=Microbacterium gilvum TaxID=1336204 RepID=A0ABP9AHV5_9MICO
MTTGPTTAVEITKVEYRGDSRYSPTPTPRLTWTTRSSAGGWLQAWAELECAGEVVRVDGRDSVHVDWPFAPLAPRETRRVRVRVAGEDGGVSDWSDARAIEAGFLGDGEWTARMIGLRAPERVAHPGLFRTTFAVREGLARATLYSTAQGVYEVSLNGSDVDDETLKPGWTAYQWRLIHESLDVTALLAPGPNAIGIRLSGGWFCERYGFGEAAVPFYGAQPSAALMLVLDYADGTTQTVSTDGTWRAQPHGPTIDAGIYAGQHDDLRLAEPGWDTASFDDAGWEPAAVVDGAVTPIPRSAPPVRRVDALPVLARTTAPSGETVLDFGQNISGRLRISADLPAGTKVVIRHAEVLAPDGELERASMGHADTTDSFIAPGGSFTWEPSHTFRGFRYAGISGWAGSPDDAAFTAVAVSSDLERTGWFDSSHELVNRFHESVVWGMRDNFVSLPTDCPQRDERLGWTGDIMWFSPTAATLFDVDGFLANWLGDLAAEQTDDGVVIPFVVPSPLPAVATAFTSPAAAWGDAATVVPAVLHERYGDRGILERQYASMTAWVDRIASIAGPSRLWKGGFQFGDWLDPFSPPEFPTEAKADAELVATAYFFQSARLLAEMAAAIGRRADADRYTALAAEIKAAFGAEYVTRGGRVASEAQTAYALAIVFGLAEDEETRQRMGDHLAALVRESGFHIGTGFAGTPFLTEALTATGHLLAADRMITQTECPSWLYPLTMGATTVWEAWDALRPDGSINPRAVSFNHYAFGSVVDWLYRVVAGIGPAEPGYRTIEIAPVPLPSFDHVSATHRTPYGDASVRWRREGDSVRISADVPANTTAVVRLPDGTAPFTIGSGAHEWTVDLVVGHPRVERLSLKTGLADIMEDPGAYAAVLGALDAHVPRVGQALRTHHTRWRRGEPLEVSIFVMPPRVRAAIDAELAEYRPSAG